MQVNKNKFKEVLSPGDTAIAFLAILVTFI